MSKLAIPRFGRILSNLRANLELTQQELADRAGVSRGLLSQVEREWKRPTLAFIERIERVTGASWSDLWKAVFSSPVPPEERARLDSYRQRTTVRQFRPYASDYRLKCAYEEYPDRMTQLETRIMQRRERVAALIFLHEAVYDSSLEAVCYSEFCSWDESTPLRSLSPMEGGYRDLPVIERSTGKIVGDRPHPALHIELPPFTLTVFPQLRLRGRDLRAYRVDGLLGVRLGRLRRWLALDINGAGHDFNKDGKRLKALRLPSVGLDEAEILSGDLKAILLGKVEAQFGIPRLAA